eukprot:7409279-Pyramimonas_sp.AAC.1
MGLEGLANNPWESHRLGHGYLCGIDPDLSNSVASPSGAAEFQAGLWLVLWLLQADVRFCQYPIVVYTDDQLVVSTAA